MPKKNEETTIITIDMERELYFAMLRVCIETNQTVDELVTSALKDFIAKNGKKTKK